MSDSYQAIYDAVRSRISGGNVSEAVAQVAREAFDTSNLQSQAMIYVHEVAQQWQRPSAVYRPNLR